jgi:hypothetical protein
MLYASHDDQSSRINRILPGTFDATKVNAPTFTAFQGWSATSGNTLSIAYAAGGSGVTSTQNSACFGIGVIVGTGQSDGTLLLSVGGTLSVVIRPYNTSSQFLSRLHGGNNSDTTAGATTSKGFFAINRDNSANYSQWAQTVETVKTRTSAAPI